MIAPASPCTLRDTLSLYELWAPDLKRRTIQRMAHDLNRCDRAWGEIHPSEVETRHFQELRRQVVEGLSATTIEGTVSTVMTLLRFLREIGELESLPAKGRVLRRPTPQLVMPTLDEFARMYQRADCTMWPRLCADRERWWQSFLATAYFTALRLSDILALEWEWIHGNRITLVARKTGKQQHIPIHPVLAKHLAYLPRHSTRVFASAKKSLKQLRRELRRMCVEAGVPNITAQQMRRLSSNEWESARPGCGELILGHGLRGAARFYLELSRPLFEAVEQLNVPSAMYAVGGGRQLSLF